MNKAILAAILIILVAIGVFLLLPEKEPTAQDKLNEAGESLAEAADLAKQALQEKTGEIEADLSHAIEDAQASASKFADDLKSSAKEAAMDIDRLQKDLKREFDEGGALNVDGYSPLRAKVTLQDVGLSEKAAQDLADWLGELYRTPERADEAISELLAKLE